MKYKYLVGLITILSFCSQKSLSQNLRLITMNPLPRVNQEIEFAYFYSNSEIENRFEAYIDNGGLNNLITGTININDSFDTNSEVVFGPIEINYKEKIVKSDHFSIKLFDKLPETERGIWINKVVIDGSVFIIIEQRIPSSLGREEFANFNRDRFFKSNVEPYEFYSQTSSFKTNGNIIGKGEYKERRTILLVRDIESLRNDLTIDESFFNDLPENCERIRLVIKKI